VKAPKPIGYIIFAPPAYSETFLWQEWALWQAQGFDLQLFAGPAPQGVHHSTLHHPQLHKALKVTHALPVKGLAAWRALPRALGLLARCWPRAWRLYRLERQQGTPLWRALKRVWFALHILPAQVKQLVFVYLPATLQRAQVASAMQVPMAICLRGFDVLPPQLNAQALHNPATPWQHMAPLPQYQALWPQKPLLLLRNRALARWAHHQGATGHMALWWPIGKAPAPAQTQARHQQPGGGQALALLCVARLHWVKGLHHLIEALALWQMQQPLQTWPPLKLTLVGQGPQAQTLQAQVQAAGLQSQVTFAGIIPPENLPALYARHHYYIQPSLFEGCCNALLEARAHGMPCLASHICGMPLQHERTGLTFAPNSPQAIVQALQQALQTPPAKWQYMQHHSRQQVLQQHHPNTLARQMQRLFGTAVSAAASTGVTAGASTAVSAAASAPPITQSTSKPYV